MATSQARRRAALAGYVRKHAFVPRYGDEQRMALFTDDGVRLAADATGEPDGFVDDEHLAVGAVVGLADVEAAQRPEPAPPKPLLWSRGLRSCSP